MTEAEWLAATDPTPMLEFLKKTASTRKLLLFAVECCRIARRNRGEDDGPDVECVVRLADGADNLAEVRRHWLSRGRTPATSYPERPFEWCSAFLRLESAGGLPNNADLVALVRELFGNPFRPVTVDPSWLTSDVRLLASGIYQDGAFDRMPILADALQDAGCTNDDILNHCRQPGAHVRGCWAIDLLLGKK